MNLFFLKFHKVLLKKVFYSFLLVDCLKILFTPKIKEEDLKYLSADFIEEFCGSLIINEGIYINCYCYFVANVMRDYLLKK